MYRYGTILKQVPAAAVGTTTTLQKAWLISNLTAKGDAGGINASSCSSMYGMNRKIQCKCKYIEMEH